MCESSSSAKSRFLTSFDDVRPTNQAAIIGFFQLVSRSSKLSSNDWENLKIVVRPGDYDVYSDRDDEKVGTVKNIWVDESDRFGYLVVDTGFWMFGKQVLLPVDRTRIDQGDRLGADASRHRRASAVGFTKEQAEEHLCCKLFNYFRW